ncbi:protein GRINL1A [Xiphias gladius]|uniref:protein GRINL1A n=1 Tax=Xiphias gladius TaxID=8245 RepID=UPI001A99CD42|nr:protein GRINL1A [Xiphias gladius]
MLRYGSGQTVSTTTTTEDSVETSSERRIKRLRLTLHAGDHGNNKPKTTNSDTAEKEKDVHGAWKKKNGLIQRERPAGRESPQQHLRDMTNGVPESSLQHHGPKVYGVVQRTGSDRQQEVMAREWTVNHLHDEMRYIREVRDSLEKVRERMYGQFGGMQQSMQKLSQEIRAANSHRRSLESEVRIRTEAMESFDQMNSSLISANIGLQKSLLEHCQNRVDTKEEVKSLQSACKKTQEKLRDKERELATVQAENQTLRLQVESSQEANTQALQELSVKLQREYEEKLLEEQRKHREEIENLQAQLNEYIRRLEEAERNIRTAEAKIAERDQRIIEVERLLDCMGKEKSQLQKKLQECDQRLRLMELTYTADATVAKRSKELQGEAVDLRERIKHLNDMVFCQQRKVKGMIEEVQSLRAQVAQKDMFISELLDRIAIIECENNELEDKLKYFVSTQSRPREVLETREIGVGCDLLPRQEAQRHDVETPVLCEPSHLHPIQLPTPVQPPSPVKPSSPTQPLSPTQCPSPLQLSFSTQPPSPTQPSLPPSPIQHPSLYLTTPTQPRMFKSNNPPPSRLESSLLKYTPVEYSRFLQSSPSVPSGTLPYTCPTDPEPPLSPVQSGRDELDAEANTNTHSNAEESTSSPSSPRARSRAPQVYTPFMKLMEMTAKINIDKSPSLGCDKKKSCVTLSCAVGGVRAPPLIFDIRVRRRTRLRKVSRRRRQPPALTERQGQVGDLRNQSREELQELLLRQEKILSNTKLLQTLPDKGKKISEFAEKVRLAIEHNNEEERRQSLVSAARTELKFKYQQAFTMRKHPIPNTPTASHQNRQSEAAAADMVHERETSPDSAHVQENTTLDQQQDQFVSRAAAHETMETAAAGASLNSDETKESDLLEALERVRLSETSTVFSSQSKDPLNSTARDNYFLRKQSPKKPHYVTVLEKTERTSAPRKQKFKPNQLPHRSDISPSGYLSPSQSSEGSLLLSVQARKERDRKHLDDITAAKLPPLHHNPAQLLSLEESAVLLKEQTKKQQEFQAKLAAQKLSEGLKTSMGSYTPDGGPMAAYREVQDEGAQISSEED